MGKIIVAVRLISFGRCNVRLGRISVEREAFFLQQSRCDRRLSFREETAQITILAKKPSGSRKMKLFLSHFL